MKTIAVSGAAGQIAYSLLFRLAAGELFHEEITLHLLELPTILPSLQGTLLELEDCAFSTLKNVVVTSDPKVAFKADLIFLLGAKPRGPGMQRKDLLKENAKIFVEQGKALQEVAPEHARVLVVGNPCNTNALVTHQSAPRIKHIYAMSRLDHNRSVSLLAKKAAVSIDAISHMTVWGNHSSTMVLDMLNARILGQPLRKVITDHQWLDDEFPKVVQERGAAIIAARGHSSAASAANAALGAMKDLIEETPKDEWYSCSLLSDGNPYGIATGLFFSFPCRTLANGEVEIVPKLEVDSDLRRRLEVTQNELLEERNDSRAL